LKSSRLIPSFGLAGIWLPPLLLAVLAWSHRCVVDDAFIDFRTVDNLLHGYGPVFNASERVEAFTSPLWIALLAFLGLLAKPFAQGRVPLEWISVLLGIACSALGLGFAGIATGRLARQNDPSARMVPFGSLAVVAPAPFWDFTTCGLETSLVFLWMGASFLGLVFLVTNPTLKWAPAWAILFGLGPLVRPDLGVFSVAFIACQLALSRGWRNRAVLAALALAAPVAYQIFRMGYFAAVVPNTALAKEAGVAFWSFGWGYLVDFFAPYFLWLPLAIVGLWELVSMRKLWHERRRTTVLVMGAPLLGAILHALFVIRVGGDFMHARFLLPAFFALILPATTVSLSGAKWLLVPLVPWAVASTLWFRVPYAENNNPKRPLISNERGVYVGMAARPQPVVVEDFVPHHGWADDGLWLAAHTAGKAEPIAGTEPKPGVFSDDPFKRGGYQSYGVDALFNGWVLADIVAYRLPVGITSYAAGTHTHVFDGQGLGDALVARERLEVRGGRLGHEKGLPSEWCVARFLASGSMPPGNDPSQVEMIRRAMGCGDLARLLAAITEPMTPARFLENLWLAPRLTALRIPKQPAVAVAEFCVPG
jgi:arabinofuranosyltransferase